MRRSNKIPLILGLIILSFFAGWVFGTREDIDSQGNNLIIQSDDKDVPSLNFKNLSNVWEILQEQYYAADKLKLQNLTDGAIKGFVDALDDPYTVYMNADETREFHQSLSGNLEGIGALLEAKENAITIVTPLKDSPSEKAGLKPGDIIIKIGDEDAMKMTLYEAVAKIRGSEGTDVTLTIFREGRDEPFEVTITRGKIELDSVTSEKKDNGIYLVTINQFSDTTQDEFQKAINEVLLNEGKGMILDLRFNGGGYLDMSIDIVSEFLAPDLPVVVIKRKNPEDNEIMYTNGNHRLLDMPLAVLVNEGSASASEIVAGAIQDHKRGVVIGTQTFGKGSVQEIQSFNDGASLRVTIAKWFTPKDRSIDEVGITPDKVVEITDSDITLGHDSQMEAAMEYIKKQL